LPVISFFPILEEEGVTSMIFLQTLASYYLTRYCYVTASMNKSKVTRFLLILANAAVVSMIWSKQVLSLVS